MATPDNSTAIGDFLRRSKIPGKRNLYCLKKSEVDRVITENVPVEEVRRLVADYMWSEGCSCCRDSEAHERHAAALGELLGVEKYEVGSGYAFSKYRTQP